LWANWLADACAGTADPTLVDAINGAVQPSFCEWRSVWAEHADGATGWPAYAQLMARLDIVAERFAGRVPLPNGMDVARLLEQSLLRAMHTPDLADGGARGSHTTPHVPDLGQTRVTSA